ncbi:MAG TPA: extracellular solute-binding protein [Microbacterium sp.]|uniref:extracellular solute-binding protein n=1 Tax=Microbacterium arabinogalactanolyticum TaxID=69365 RepID=UPI002C1BC602|nr:extracellular solute-binding protein [Microbacterium sp.]
MRKLKRVVVIATVGAVAAAALVGCGPKTGSEGDAKGVVKMVTWPGPEGDAMAKVVKAYNAGQGKKDGITVDNVLISREDTFNKEVALMTAKDSSMDVYFTATYNVGQFSASLDALDGIDTSAYFPVAVDGLKYNDKLYALPLDVSNHFLYYRTDLLDALASDPAQTAKYAEISKKVVGEALVPKKPEDWSMDDFKATVAYFSQAENPASPTKYGTILQAKDLLYNTMIWNDVLWGYGGSWTDDSGKAAIDSDAGRKAVQLYADIYKNGWTSPDSAQAEFPETQAALQSGQVAVALQWSAAYADLADAAKSPKIADKIAIAPVPGGASHVHALAVAINKYGKNKAAARKWLEYLATPEAMDAYAKAGGIPAMPDVLKQNTDLNAAFPVVIDAVSKGYAEPVFPKTFEAYKELADALSPAWVGQKPADEAVKQANAKLQDLLP